MKGRRILLEEKPGENNHFLDHTCSNSPARRKPRRKQNLVILSLVLTVELREKGQEKTNLGLYLLFSCQEKTPECQEKTDVGHFKLGFDVGARRKGPMARRKQIWACICFSPARRKRLSARTKQISVILSLDFTVEPGEKVSGLGENEFRLVFAFLLPGENA